MAGNIDRFIYRLFRKGELELLTLVGRLVGTATVLQKDSEGLITLAKGTSLPSVGEATYAKGAMFLKTDAADGTSALYENTGLKTSCNFTAFGGDVSAAASLSVLTSTADSKAVIADSKAVSVSVITSANLATGDSKATSLSVLASTADSKAVIADSKAVSNSVIASSNLATGDSKATSLSTLTSTVDSKADVADSKAVSVSTLTSTADSKADVADSKAVSVSVIVSSNLATSDSKAASNSVVISTTDSKLASHIGA